MQRFKFGLLLFLLGFAMNTCFAQATDTDDEETYCRANIAFTDFLMLGKSATTYARCVKAENYLDPGRTQRYLDLNGEGFQDDGQGNDLAAGDGIMTSVNSYTYAKGQAIVQPGLYRSISQALLYDETFQHKDKFSGERFKIGCKLIWIRCRDLPMAERITCHLRAHPFNGYFILKECEFGWEW